MTSIIITYIKVLVIYMHITAEFKKSNILDIYESDYTSNDQLQETCKIKQPFIFNINDEFDCIIYNGNIELKGKTITNRDYFYLTNSAAEKLMETDEKSQYYTECNFEFSKYILEKMFNKIDVYIKPNYTMYSNYDYMFGSVGSYTPLRYHQYSRFYLFVKSGELQVKMIPWKYNHNLELVNDFNEIERFSKIDVWNVQEEYKDQVEKIKYLDFTLYEGNFLYIPSYWCYSIKYKKQSKVFGIQYKSYMNCLVNIPEQVMHYYEITKNNNTNITSLVH